jgi:hypothetical protein
MVFLLRVLVTRTSVVEMGSKHLGDALEEMPQGKRYLVPSGSSISDESHGQATEKAADLDEAGGHSPSEKVLRWA